MTNLPPPPPGGAPAQPSQKTSDIIGHLRPTKQFKFSNPSTAATSLAFDDSGDFLLAALSDETLQLYNCREGRADKTLLSKKYGCHLARFTHHSQSIIYASTKENDGIRYLSTHNNQYIRYFMGHNAAVTSLNLCPANDTFCSSSASDHTVRLWNLSSPNSHGKLSLATPTLTAYDPTATVLAIASPATSSILLYDLRNFDRAPFATFDLSELDATPHIARQAQLNGSGRTSHPQDWTTLSFSNDGKCILLGTNSDAGHILLDAFSGSARAFLVRHNTNLPLNPQRQRPAPWQPPPSSRSNTSTSQPFAAPPPFPPGAGDVTMTPDANFVVGSSGGERDCVVWDVSSVKGVNEEAAVLEPALQLPCKGMVGVLEFNPRYNMLATAEREVVMWLPDEFVGDKVPGD